MAAPIYFFPRLRLDELVQGDRLVPGLLARYGLAQVLDGLGSVEQATCRQEMTAAGPGGASGTMLSLLTAGKPPLRFGHYPQFQRWQKVRSEPELWIGVDTEHPPGPADLARPTLLDGYPVRLADGQEYVVPIIRSPDPAVGTHLPRDVYQDADGQWQIEVARKYETVWEESGRFWDFYVGNESMPLVELIGYAIRFLGVNYRYGPQEHAVLRLVQSGPEGTGKLLEAVFDWPHVESMLSAQKKSESPTATGPSSSASGSAAASPNTGPAGPSSGLPQ